MKYLYHGTAFSKLPGIAQHGLVPRTGPSIWKDHPSIKGRVYLTSTYAVHFAQAAAQHWKDTGNLMLLRIDMEKLGTENLAADEDVIAQTYASKHGIPLKEFHKKLLAAPELYEHYLTWEESLAMLGTVAHVGPIPVDAIDKIVVLTGLTSMELIQLSDAMVSVVARRFMGVMYEADLGWLFGGAEGPKPSGELFKDKLETDKKFYEHWLKFSETIRPKTHVFDTLDEAMQLFARTPTKRQRNKAKEGRRK